MLVHVTLTGPARVVLGRSAVDLALPGGSCTLADLLTTLADAEPRIARYLMGEDRRPHASLRPLLNDALLELGSPIPQGATVTLIYAVAGGRGAVGEVRGRTSGTHSTSKGIDLLDE